MLTVITGPPCSGKTTYVRQHSLPGDIVIDFDAIAQAFGSPVTHGHGDLHWKMAVETRDTAITTAVGLATGTSARAWIIDSRPAPSRRTWYARHGARIVDLTAPAAELHRRADADGRPADWHRRIDQYLAGGDPEPSPRTRW